MDAVYRILRYLKRNPGKGLLFKKNGHIDVEGYCDANWASCPDDRRSTSSYCVFVGGNLVIWRSKKQPVVSRSTAEAEYRAMSQSLSELLRIKNLLTELKLLEANSMKLRCDNKSAINIANNPGQHDRTKHVEIDRFFIRKRMPLSAFCVVGRTPAWSRIWMPNSLSLSLLAYFGLFVVFIRSSITSILMFNV